MAEKQHLEVRTSRRSGARSYANVRSADIPIIQAGEGKNRWIVLPAGDPERFSASWEFLLGPKLGPKAGFHNLTKLDEYWERDEVLEELKETIKPCGLKSTHKEVRMTDLANVVMFIRQSGPEIWDVIHREIAHTAAARNKLYVATFHPGMRVRTAWPGTDLTLYGRVIRTRGDRVLVSAEKNCLRIGEFWSPATEFTQCIEESEAADGKQLGAPALALREQDRRS